jgi:hypothetical protein
MAGLLGRGRFAGGIMQMPAPEKETLPTSIAK